MATTKKSVYEQEFERRENVGLYEQIANQISQRKNQQQSLRIPLEEKVSKIKDPAVRTLTLNDIMKNEELQQQIYTEYVNKLNEEAKKGENLEAIVNSAPIERIVNSLSYIPPTDEVSEKYDKLKEYNKILNIERILKVAQKERNEDITENLIQPIKEIVSNYVISNEVTEDKDTKEFLKTFVKVMSKEFLFGIYRELGRKANAYFGSVENETDIRGYVKETLGKDNNKIPIFYNVIFAHEKSEKVE